MNVRKYRTVLATAAGVLVLSLAGNAAPQVQKTAQNDPDMKEVFNYVLTMDKIKKLAAVENDMEALQKSNPQLTKDMEAGGSGGNLDQMTQRLQKYPPVVAILKKDGVAPREYIVGTLVLIQAGTAVAFKKSGTYKEYPPKMLTTMNPANLALLEQRWDEITKIMPAFSNQ